MSSDRLRVTSQLRARMSSMSTDTCEGVAFPRQSLAPMVDVSTASFRLLTSLISRNTIVYTPMIVDKQVQNLTNVTKSSVTAFFPVEHARGEMVEKGTNFARLVAQISGNDANEQVPAAHYLSALGYHEINLNMGCPASSAQSGEHGAVLMLSPDFWKAIERVRRESASIVTIKCRQGVNQPADRAWFTKWVCDMIANTGVYKYIIHGRIAVLGKSTKSNLKVPPIHPQWAAFIRKDVLEYTEKLRMKCALYCLFHVWNDGKYAIEHHNSSNTNINNNIRVNIDLKDNMKVELEILTHKDSHTIIYDTDYTTQGPFHQDIPDTYLDAVVELLLGNLSTSVREMVQNIRNNTSSNISKEDIQSIESELQRILLDTNVLTQVLSVQPKNIYYISQNRRVYCPSDVEIGYNGMIGTPESVLEQAFGLHYKVDKSSEPSEDYTSGTMHNPVLPEIMVGRGVMNDALFPMYYDALCSTIAQHVNRTKTLTNTDSTNIPMNLDHTLHDIPIVTNAMLNMFQPHTSTIPICTPVNPSRKDILELYFQYIRHACENGSEMEGEYKDILQYIYNTSEYTPQQTSHKVQEYYGLTSVSETIQESTKQQLLKGLDLLYIMEAIHTSSIDYTECITEDKFRTMYLRIRNAENVEDIQKEYQFGGYNDLKARCLSTFRRVNKFLMDTVDVEHRNQFSHTVPNEIIAPLITLFNGVLNGDYWRKVCHNALHIHKKPEFLLSVLYDNIISLHTKLTKADPMRCSYSPQELEILLEYAKVIKASKDTILDERAFAQIYITWAQKQREKLPTLFLNGLLPCQYYPLHTIKNPKQIKQLQSVYSLEPFDIEYTPVKPITLGRLLIDKYNAGEIDPSTSLGNTLEFIHAKFIHEKPLYDAFQKHFDCDLFTCLPHPQELADSRTHMLDITMQYFTQQLAFINAMGTQVLREDDVERNPTQVYSAQVQPLGIYGGCITHHTLNIPVLDYHTRSQHQAYAEKFLK